MSDRAIYERDGEIFAAEGIDEVADAIAARIMSGDMADEEIRKILEETGSIGYARVVAERAAGILSEHLLSDDLEISVVDVPASRLAKFIGDARSQIALAQAR